MAKMAAKKTAHKAACKTVAKPKTKKTELKKNDSKKHESKKQECKTHDSTQSHRKKREIPKSTTKTQGKKKMTKTETKTSTKKTPAKTRSRTTGMMPQMSSSQLTEAKMLRRSPLTMRTTLGQEASRVISGVLNLLLADVFALYLKTKNFHWHVSGPNFRDYHLMFDDQAGELLSMVDGIAERVRKVGGTTIRSIGNIAQLQHIPDNNADYVEPSDMLAELYEDNLALTSYMREVHGVCDTYNDSATTGLLDGWIDEAEQRSWFLFETSRRGDSSGH